MQQSLLNDGGLKDYAVLAISEPYARTIDGAIVTVPTGHHNWAKLIPTTRRKSTWPIRSMLLEVSFGVLNSRQDELGKEWRSSGSSGCWSNS